MWVLVKVFGLPAGTLYGFPTPDMGPHNRDLISKIYFWHGPISQGRRAWCICTYMCMHEYMYIYPYDAPPAIVLWGTIQVRVRVCVCPAAGTPGQLTLSKKVWLQMV